MVASGWLVLGGAGGGGVCRVFLFSYISYRFSCLRFLDSFFYLFYSFFFFCFCFRFLSFFYLLHSRTLRSLSRQKSPKRGLRKAEDADIARKGSTSQTEKVQRATTVHSSKCTKMESRSVSFSQSHSHESKIAQLWYKFGRNNDLRSRAEGNAMTVSNDVAHNLLNRPYRIYTSFNVYVDDFAEMKMGFAFINSRQGFRDFDQSRPGNSIFRVFLRTRSRCTSYTYIYLHTER